MDPSEAKAVLLRHLECRDEDDTILGWLRPYRGVEDRHLAEILGALLAAAPALNGPAEVDRELIHAIWELCRTIRAWTRGPHEPMFHGRHFIPPAEKDRLDRWTDEVESIALSLLYGRPALAAFSGLPRYIVEWGLGPRAASFAPLFAEMLLELGGEEMDGEGHLNDGVVLCRALGSMGPAARRAAEAIRAADERSTHPEAKAAAEEALKAIG